MARTSYYSGNTVSREDLASILHALGIQGDDLWKLVAIAGRESHYDVGAHGTDQPREKLSGDRGLFQINSTHDDALKKAGIIRTASDLFDPVTNARAAVFLYRQSGLSPWNAGPGGFTAGGNPLFGTDPMAAQAAVNNVAQAGWDDRSALAGSRAPRTPAPSGPPSLADIAEGLGNLGAPGYKQYATDPRRQINSRYQAIMSRFGGGGQGGPAGFGNLGDYYSWSSHPGLIGQAPYTQLSPHLQMFEKWVEKNYGGASADPNQFNVRKIDSSDRYSPHSFGAAFDWAPANRDSGLKAVQTIINNPAAFGIQAVHDYVGGRIWHAERAAEGGSVEAGWKPYDFPPGDAHDTHFHFEVNPDTFDDASQQNWQWMNQAMKGTFRAEGKSLTPEQFGQYARRLGNRGNPLFEDYATISRQLLQKRQNRFTANTPGQPGGTAGPPSKALETLLGDLGINYPNPPTPDPSLLAYLSGLGLDMDKAKDLRNTALRRIRGNAASARQDIRTAAGRAKENLTTDLISRGVLSSGEANKRYTRQYQDVAKARTDLATQTGYLKEDARFGYGQSVEDLKRDAIQRVADLDTQQQVQQAANKAQARGLRRASRAAQDQFEREQQTRETGNQQIIDLINSLSQGQGYGSPYYGTLAPYQPPYQPSSTIYRPGGSRY